SHFLPTALNKKDVAIGGPAKPLSKSDENLPLRHYPCRLWHLADQHDVVRKVRSRVEIRHWFSANPRGDREWFQESSRSMPKDHALIGELTAPTYTFSSR